jgi:NAD(P)H dehydrogenase (quinone)
MSCCVLVAFHSGSGSVRQLALAVAQGASEAGADVRLRRVGAGSDPDDIARASVDDLLWADGVVFGGPTYFGNVSAPLLHFLASAADVASAGLLADKVISGFTTASSPNGGQEASLLALYHTVHHWGAVIAPTGYTHRALRAVGGNPYGLSVTRRHGEPVDDETALTAARLLGRRVATVAARLAVRVAATH